MSGPNTTVWTPYKQTGEYNQTGNPNLDSEAGLDLITEAGLSLVEEDTSFTSISPTTWSTNDTG